MEKIKCMYFERGAYFSGELAYTIWELEDCMLLESQSYNDFAYMENYSFLFPKEEMQKFEAIINKVIKWDKNYKNKSEVLDGYGWEIQYSFRTLEVYTEGYEAYPHNFKKIVHSLQKIIEELCGKYADNYVLEEAHSRLLL